MTSNCLQNMEKNRRPEYKDIKSAYRNEIWHRKKFHANNEKRKPTNDGINKTKKSKKNQEAQRKGILQVLWIIGRRHDQTSQIEKKGGYHI